MLVHVITHGEHAKSGNTPETYDGPLTTAGARDVLSLKDQIPQIDHAFCGIQERHRQAAGLLDFFADQNIQLEGMAGNDVIMSRLDAGDESAVDEIWLWLIGVRNSLVAKISKRPEELSILLVTSRSWPLIFFYKLNGGAEKFGDIGKLTNAVIALAKYPGTKMPLMKSGALHTFEV